MYLAAVAASDSDVDSSLRMWRLLLESANFAKAVALEGVRTLAKTIVFGRVRICSTIWYPMPRLAPVTSQTCVLSEVVIMVSLSVYDESDDVLELFSTDVLPLFIINC